MNEKDIDVIACEQLYDGHVRLETYRLRHKQFSGGWGNEISRELIDRGRAVGVLPYDPVRDEVVLIRQFRIGAWKASHSPWMVETVAGLVEDGESPEDVARRECVEEAGCEFFLCTLSVTMSRAPE